MSDLRAVCHIPTAECLAHHDIGHWISLFESRSGQTPTDMVLPAFTTTGTSFVSEYASPIPGLGDDSSLRHWIEALRGELDGARKWALIQLQLATLANDMIALRDQWNQAIPDSCCIINPHVHSMLQTIFGEVRQLGVDGIALDITDIYPNSTSSRYPPRKNATQAKQPLQNSCFCAYCRDELNRGGWRDGATPFMSIEGNISRFVLQPVTRPYGGADPITVEDSWIEKLDGEKLVDFANIRGFVEIDSAEQRENAIKDAAHLLRYMAVRSKVTAQAIKKLRAAAAHEGLTMAVILGSGQYDQSQNVNLSTLLKLSCADEYWAESFNPEHLALGASDPDETAPALLRLMATRGTYYVNACFEYLHLISKIRTLDADEPVLTRLVETGAGLDRRDQLDRGQCAQIPLFKGLQGFVGVPFKTPDLVDLVKKMATTGSLADSVKNEVVARLGTSSVKMGATAEPDAQIQDDWG